MTPQGLFARDSPAPYRTHATALPPKLTLYHACLTLPVTRLSAYPVVRLHVYITTTSSPTKWSSDTVFTSTTTLFSPVFPVP
ncbi:uncharacterized protein YALI1_F36678g [Yarrowia lipolytica]|uniref:Uncharacterized protein n=1 Tax=Yarrowia lipolytica TaxID=4952 RepID=A0A1D8NQD9_YARLL|nr:hypothetical protein YALI1_F36678g [Yarrowia lipolytica]